MANLGFEINTSDLPENENNFDPLPPGSYDVVIDGCDVKTTKDGSGQYLNLKLKVVSDSYTNRIIFSMVNIRNKSEQAERIGQQQLRSILEAVNIQKLSDTDQLIGNIINVKIDIQTQDGYDPKNNVKAYKKSSMGSVTPQTQNNIFTPVSNTTNNQTAPAQNKQTPPWMKR
jgi:hypothetical protein